MYMHIDLVYTENEISLHASRAELVTWYGHLIDQDHMCRNEIMLISYSLEQLADFVCFLQGWVTLTMAIYPWKLPWMTTKEYITSSATSQLLRSQESMNLTSS